MSWSYCVLRWASWVRRQSLGVPLGRTANRLAWCRSFLPECPLVRAYDSLPQSVGAWKEGGREGVGYLLLRTTTEEVVHASERISVAQLASTQALIGWGVERRAWHCLRVAKCPHIPLCWFQQWWQNHPVASSSSSSFSDIVCYIPITAKDKSVSKRWAVCDNWQVCILILHNTHFQPLICDNSALLASKKQTHSTNSLDCPTPTVTPKKIKGVWLMMS